MFWDCETTGRQGDYDSITVVSCKPYGRKPVTFQIRQLGNDQRVVREAKEYLEKADAWVTYYGKGFDVPFLNTRLLKWSVPPVDPRPHVDMYFSLKPKMLVGRRSQAHLLEFLETPQKKMTVSPNVWAGLAVHFKENMAILVRRCESDTRGLEALYKKTKHLIRDVPR